MTLGRGARGREEGASEIEGVYGNRSFSLFIDDSELTLILLTIVLRNLTDE